MIELRKINGNNFEKIKSQFMQCFIHEKHNWLFTLSINYTDISP